MKKLCLVMLGALALALGPAGPARAEFEVHGEFEAYGIYDFTGDDPADPYDWEGLRTGWDTADLLLTISGPLGENIAGSITFAYDAVMRGDFPDTTSGAVFIHNAEFIYNFNDRFHLGYMYHEFLDYQGYRLLKTNATGEDIFYDRFGHIHFTPYDTIKAGYKFDKGQVTAWIGADLDSVLYIYAKGDYEGDRLSLAGWLGFDEAPEKTVFVGKLAYDLAEEWALTGYLGYRDEPAESYDGRVFLGGKAAYAGDGFKAVLRAEYDVDLEELYDYRLKATLTPGGNFKPYVFYDDDDEFGVGFDWYFGAMGSEIYAEYTTAGEKLCVFLYLCF